MKLTPILFTILIVSIFLNACQTKVRKTPLIEQLSQSGSDAVGPYFTKDQEGNPVLCWTEKDEQDSLFRLKFATYNVQFNTFSNPITVFGTEGCSTASESMSKIAFKDDGTIVALFNKAFENAESRFASAIYYTLSTDGGRHWTEPELIHSETSQTYGRSFFSMSTLADGEVGAIWLDGRLGEAEKGSALFFSKTQKGGGFGEDRCLDKNTCECCRTEILRDSDGGIHIAYRGIQFPFDHLGKQVRDMVYSYSKDNGETFTPAKHISKDNWEIEGCPHTGPSLASNKDGIHAVWFTGAGVSGLYLSSLEDVSQGFEDKRKLSSEGRHPQMVSIKDNGLAIVWDEVLSKGQRSENESIKHDHTNAMTMENYSTSDYSRIIMTLFSNGRIVEQFPISNESQVAHHPVIASLENGILAAWVNEEAGRPAIAYSFIEID